MLPIHTIHASSPYTSEAEYLLIFLMRFHYPIHFPLSHFLTPFPQAFVGSFVIGLAITLTFDLLHATPWSSHSILEASVSWSCMSKRVKKVAIVV